MQPGRDIFGLVFKQTWYWEVCTALTTTVFHAPGNIPCNNDSVFDISLSILDIYYHGLVQSQPQNRVGPVQGELVPNTSPFNPPFISCLIMLSHCDRATHHSLLLHFSSHPLHSKLEKLSEIYLKLLERFPCLQLEESAE